MRTAHPVVLGIIVASLCSVFLLAEEHEKKINRSDLPAAVEKTISSHTEGATIRGFNQQEENGKTYYEAELTVNGRSKDILIDPSGAIVEVEEQVDFTSLPSPVQKGLQAKAGAGKLGKVESITKDDKVVAYEAKVTANGRRSEIQVGGDGKALDHEE